MPAFGGVSLALTAILCQVSLAHSLHWGKFYSGQYSCFQVFLSLSQKYNHCIAVQYAITFQVRAYAIRQNTHKLMRNILYFSVCATGSVDESDYGQTEVYNSTEDSPNRSPPATAPKPRPKPTAAPPVDYAGRSRKGKKIQRIMENRDYAHGKCSTK